MTRIGTALLAGIVLAGTVLAASGCAPATQSTSASGPVVVSTLSAGPYRGAELDPTRSYALPDVTLTDTSGVPYNVRSGSAAQPVSQPVTVMFFGYSNCPDVCTGILADIAGAMNRLTADQRTKVRVVLVTTDPARDTPAQLKTYLSRIDPSFVGLTGDLATISAAARSVGVPIEDAKQLPSGGYEVVHGTQVIGFARNQAVVVWTYPTAVGDLRADIETLLAKQS